MVHLCTFWDYSSLSPTCSCKVVTLILSIDEVLRTYYHILCRNSLSSPVRRINATRTELMRETILRDQARVTSIHKHITQMVSRATTPAQDFMTPLFSGLTFGTGEYFALVGVGTPHIYMYLDVDTGSDITWLQCAPCANCYKQKNALFYPSNSSTFEVLGCHSDLCLSLDVMGCISNKCLYQVQVAISFKLFRHSFLSNCIPLLA